jgi:nucleotide-binding universal stress UspA family protein
MITQALNGGLPLPSDNRAHLEMREGVPEQILKESEEGHYELVMLGGAGLAGVAFSEKILSAISKWSRSSLTVTPRVLTGDPARVILEIARDYGLMICLPNKKKKSTGQGI